MLNLISSSIESISNVLYTTYKSRLLRNFLYVSAIIIIVLFVSFQGWGQFKKTDIYYSTFASEIEKNAKDARIISTKLLSLIHTWENLSNESINNDDRQKLIKKMRDMLYAQSRIDINQLKKNNPEEYLSLQSNIGVAYVIAADVYGNKDYLDEAKKHLNSAMDANKDDSIKYDLAWYNDSAISYKLIGYQIYYHAIKFNLGSTTALNDSELDIQDSKNNHEIFNKSDTKFSELIKISTELGGIQHLIDKGIIANYTVRSSLRKMGLYK